MRQYIGDYLIDEQDIHTENLAPDIVAAGLNAAYLRGYSQSIARCRMLLERHPLVSQARILDAWERVSFTLRAQKWRTGPAGQCFATAVVEVAVNHLCALNDPQLEGADNDMPPWWAEFLADCKLAWEPAKRE